MPPPPRWSRDSVISFFPNHGRGNISKAADFPVGITTSAFASGLATGDLTGDGFPEVVALDGRRSNLTILEKHPVAYGVDCNANSIPDTCELAGNDCNENAIPDDCDLASGAADCNRNTIPDSCEADCNQNHSPDDCDLASGTSRDCNLNGVPDDCDVRPSRIGFEVVSVGPPSIMPFRTILPADMDGDGDPDLVEIEEWGPVRILENRPGRSFELLAEIVLPSPGGSVAADDFEGDGDLDLAVALLQADLVAFFIQDGDHSFRAGPSRPVKAPATLTAGDFDRDGDADLALATIDSGDDSLVLLRNRGSGTFDSVRSPVQGVWPTTFAAHDLDDDGALDLTVRLQGVTGGVLWNDGQGSFREASTFGVPAWGFAVADLDGDSDLDAALGVGNGIISIVRNAGGRNFLTPTPETSGLLGSVIVAADFDLDRDVDLAASQLHDPTMGMDGGLELLPNGGNGSFVRRKEIASEGFITYILAVADFDEDGAPDLAVARTQNAYSKYELVFLFSFTSGQRSRDGNENQVPDECEGPLFHRGDLDGSGSLEVTDPIRGLRALFLGGEQPACAEAADANNDARIDITDMIDLLEYLFRGGPAPATPGPPPGACNQDPDPRGSPGDLGCAAYAGC
jgi:hypothetical protein